MTKQELLARLLHEPILIEPLATAGYHRIALHADRDPKNGVWIALASSSSTQVVRDRGAAYACLGGRHRRLTDQEVEGIVSRLRGFFAFSS